MRLWIVGSAKFVCYFNVWPPIIRLIDHFSLETVCYTWTEWNEIDFLSIETFKYRMLSQMDNRLMIFAKYALQWAQWAQWERTRDTTLYSESICAERSFRSLTHESMSCFSPKKRHSARVCLCVCVYVCVYSNKLFVFFSFLVVHNLFTTDNYTFNFILMQTMWSKWIGVWFNCTFAP